MSQKHVLADYMCSLWKEKMFRLGIKMLETSLLGNYHWFKQNIRITVASLLGVS